MISKKLMPIAFCLVPGALHAQHMHGHDHVAMTKPASFASGTTPLSAIAVDGRNLLIPRGSRVMIDKNIDVQELRIDGELVCPANGQFTLQATGVLINGVFECGNANARFTGRLDLVLKPGQALSSMGERAIGVHGVLKLFGDGRNAEWQQIQKTARAGDRTLTLEKPTNWRAGDEIVLAPTGFDPKETERLTVESVSGITVQLKQALQFQHWGENQKYDLNGKQWTLNERAEVANLSRNIRIYPSGAAESHNYIGAHMMVMRGGSAYVDGVEFIRMGQMGTLGRYPFHWHRVGNARGQFIANSSIHDTYQRCVTIHGTQEARVENNVCFNHFGHGFFLEDGDEVRNVITKNLGILSKVIPKERAILLSDNGGGPLDRFPSPSTFWISNPANTVTNNTAAASEGTGFWMSFSTALKCEDRASNCVDAKSSREATHQPIKENTLAFDNNTAHTALVGITWDGVEKNARTEQRSLETAHYSPKKVPVFNNLVAYKSRYAGIYFRGRTAEFRNTIVADNKWSLFFAYNQVVKNSLIIGRSANHQAADYDYLTANGVNPSSGPFTFTGIVLYDGPFDLDDVDFAGFSASRESYKSLDTTSYPMTVIGGANRWTNKTQKLRFSPKPLAPIWLTTDHNWLDTAFSTSLRDLDGSLSGVANKVLVPRHEFNNHRLCQDRKDLNALLCDYRLGLIILAGGNTFPFAVTRSDGAKTAASVAESEKSLMEPAHPYQNKWHMILGNDFIYSVALKNASAPPATIPFVFQTEKVGEISPIVRFEGLGGNCRLSGQRSVRNLQELQASNRAAQFVQGNDLYVRVVAKEGNSDHVSLNASTATSGQETIECRQVASQLNQIHRHKLQWDFVFATENSVRGYEPQGLAFALSKTDGGGQRALYRCSVGGAGSAHFLSTDLNCEGQGQAGVLLGFMSQTPGGSTKPLYRFFHPGRGHHFHSTSIDQPIDTVRDGYKQEGIMGYVW